MLRTKYNNKIGLIEKRSWYSAKNKNVQSGENKIHNLVYYTLKKVTLYSNIQYNRRIWQKMLNTIPNGFI